MKTRVCLKHFVHECIITDLVTTTVLTTVDESSLNEKLKTLTTKEEIKNSNRIKSKGR